MKKINLPDGTPIYCLKATEAVVLDDHVQGYFNHGIKIKEDDVIIDVGANIGVFGLKASKLYEKLKFIALSLFLQFLKYFQITKSSAEIQNFSFTKWAWELKRHH